MLLPLEFAPLDEVLEELDQTLDFFLPLFPFPSFFASLCALRFRFFLLSFHSYSFLSIAPLCSLLPGDPFSL